MRSYSRARTEVKGAPDCAVCSVCNACMVFSVTRCLAPSKASITSLCNQAGVFFRFFHMHTVSLLVAKRRISDSMAMGRFCMSSTASVSLFTSA